MAYLQRLFSEASTWRNIALLPFAFASAWFAIVECDTRRAVELLSVGSAVKAFIGASIVDRAGQSNSG